MTSNLGDVKTTDFLNIHYDNVDFYVNRQQFSGSSICSIVAEAKLNPDYFRNITAYDDKRLLVFDLNSYFMNNFDSKLNGSARLNIVVDTDRFSYYNKKMIEQKLLADEKLYSKRYIGCLIPGSSEIKKSPVKQFHLFSEIFTDILMNYGIRACFFSCKKIAYLIDLENIIISALLNQREV